MLRSLDLAPILNTPQDQRSAGFYSMWRPYFYGTLDPSSFIVSSVNLELEGVKAFSPTPTSTSRVKRKPKAKGRPRKSAPKVDLEEDRGVVYWLSKVKVLLEENKGGLSPEVVNEMQRDLRSGYDISSSARERAQLAYVLRTLGYNFLDVLDGQNELYSVIMEYDSGAGPTMLFASCDSLAFSYWHSGGAKWSSFDRGEGTLLTEKIGSLGRELMEKYSMGDEGVLNIEALRDGELPALPVSPDVRFSFVTSSGIRTISFASRDSISPEFIGLYKLFMELGRVLGGRDHDILGSGDELAEPKSVYPLQLSTLGGLLAPLSLRWIAFLIDIGVYALILGLIFYFFSPMVHSWGFLPATVFYGLILFLLPLLGAWMESSAEWGYSTIGKRLMGIHVHGIESSEISLSQALARNMTKYVLSPMFLFCGFVWAFFNPAQRTWHDLLADTVVLNGSVDPFMVFSAEESLITDDSSGQSSKKI